MNTQYTLKHTPECDTHHNTWRVALDKYEARWPNTCKTCKGWGGTYDDPCPDCIEHGKCPRCGQEVWTVEDWEDGEPVECSACGWKEDSPDGMPCTSDCGCWEYSENWTQEPETPPLITVPDNPMQAGRLQKALDRVYRFKSGTMTLGEFLASITPTRRSEYVRHYASKKRRGCYAELATPKHEYTVWWMGDEGRETGIDIPKIVHDAMDLPASTSSDWYAR